MKGALEEVLDNWNDPWWRRQRLLSRVAGPMTRVLYGAGGERVMEKDWDNLFVFDACRHDLFEEVLGTDRFDDYRRMRSRGENSPEWMRNNFNGGQFPDTIYVVANPWTGVLDRGVFFEVVDVFDRVNEFASTHSDPEFDWERIGTVPASVMNAVASDIHEDHPNKRLIVHYFQPHHPVIGRADGEIDVDERLEPREGLITGKISRQDIWEGYGRNLEYVFHHARRLHDHLDGKTAITADHGELFGEVLWPIPIRGYAHPAGVYHPRLTTVPWAELAGDRRTITEGELSDEEHRTNEELLRKLGYLD